MLKIIVVTILSIICLEQNVFGQNLNYGINLGVGVANYRFLDTRDNVLNDEELIADFIPSTSINFRVNYNFISFFGTSIEPGVIMKGNSGTNLLTGRPNGKERQIHIVLPVFGEVTLLNKIHLKIGHELSYVASVSVTEEVSGFSDNISRLYDRRIESSLCLGAHIDLSNRISFGLRYAHGLTYLNRITFTDQFGNISGVGEQYNRYFNLSVGYLLNRKVYVVD